jgi:hypothetical protein
MRHVTSAIALAAAVILAGGGAGAQTSADPAAGDPTDAGRGAGSTQTAAPGPSPDPRSDQPGRAQMLTPEQQQAIARILTADGVPADATGIEEVRPGAVIPRTTTLRPVPAKVVEIAPGYADYGFVAIAGQICIVDPQTLVIIAVLPAA